MPIASPCGWPTTAGTLHPACTAGQRLGIISHLNNSGSAQLYATYLDAPGGGSAPTGVAADGNGNAYVTGATASTNFPVTPGAFQTSVAEGKSSTGGRR